MRDLSEIRILLVDDQSDARALMRGMLGGMGITQIFESSNGREALKFLDATFDFLDLIICDWNMPSMTGLELLRQLRTVDPNLPFLMVTSRSDMDSVIAAKSAQVTAYIRKPFSPAQLEAKIRIVLHRAGTLDGEEGEQSFSEI